MSNAIFLLFIFLILSLVLSSKKSKPVSKTKNRDYENKKFRLENKENFKFKLKKDLKPIHISVKITNINTECAACCGSSVG